MSNSAGDRSIDRVLAVVVSYNAGETIAAVVSNLAEQVGHIYVVDNGSDPESLRVLASLEREGRIELRKLDRNMGVGYALNCGIERARQSRFEWLLTMDQDSVPCPNMVTRMLAFDLDDEKPLILAPTRVSHGSNVDTLRSRSVKYAITSGNLVHLSVFSAIGGYNVDYFVDAVDFEFSLRARRRGYSIWKVASAKMLHDVGEGRSAVPRFLARFYTQHSPVRRYYSVRNAILLSREFFAFDAGFTMKLLTLQVMHVMLVLIFDNERSNNFRKIVDGVRDGLRGRSGKYVEFLQ